MSTPADHLFRFDLDAAIRDQLIRFLESSPKLPLARNVGPTQSGVYALYWKGSLVYVGKAVGGDRRGRRTVRQCLGRHFRKIQGRQGICVSEMEYRFMSFDHEWQSFLAESAILLHSAPEWNDMGIDG